MEKQFWGLNKIALTICVGIPVIISMMSFFNTGVLNIPGTFVMFLIMVGFVKLIMVIMSIIKKLKK